MANEGGEEGEKKTTGHDSLSGASLRYSLQPTARRTYYNGARMRALFTRVIVALSVSTAPRNKPLITRFPPAQLPDKLFPATRASAPPAFALFTINFHSPSRMRLAAAPAAAISRSQDARRRR